MTKGKGGIRETQKDEFFYKEVRGGYRLTMPAQFYTGIFPAGIVVHGKCSLGPTGLLYCPVNSFWNGADDAVDTDTNMRGSLGHDKLIDMVQAGKLPCNFVRKVKVDLLYFRLCLEDGMNIFRALYHFAAILKNPWHRKLKGPWPGDIRPT